jgi:hypothetical protein
VASSATGSDSASSAPISHAQAPVVPVLPVACRTRLQSGITKPKEYTDGTIRYDRIKFGNYCSTGETSNSTEAFADARWKTAMDEEYSALMKNQT